MGERIKYVGPSPFVLKRDGTEVRLNAGEKINLEPGVKIHDDRQIISIEVRPAQRLLNLRIRYDGGGMVSAVWGLTKKAFGSQDLVFGVSLTGSALAAGDSPHIIGSTAHFDDTLESLSGEGWQITYKPL